ncbi:hypothetical protein [Actinosynnema sp. NPDC023587]|uniref:hypothetical protein n=1 Tax=Actinosynnema sp. NPDC023587 TaxID=3154695 RepID=UPI0033DB1CB8
MPIPDQVVWASGRRVVIGPPDGDLMGPIAAVEAVADISAGTGLPQLAVRCALEPGDLEALAAGGCVWISFYGGGMPPFSVAVGP